MKKKSALMLSMVIFMLSSSCKKENGTDNSVIANTEIRQPAPPGCGVKYLNLVVNPFNGNSWQFLIWGTPASPPMTVALFPAGSPPIGSTSPGGILFMTGLSYDPNRVTCYGITGNSSNFPDQIITFSPSSPDVATTTPLILSAGMNLSDIERSPSTGIYYAIDRGNNSLVSVDVITGVVSPMAPYTINPTGLTIDCNGRIFLMEMNGVSGDIYEASPASGAIICGPSPYPGFIAPGAPAGNTEMGLHFDCACSNEFVAGASDPGNTPILTGGSPGVAPCFSPPSFWGVLSTYLEPTVDFSSL